MVELRSLGHIPEKTKPLKLVNKKSREVINKDEENLALKYSALRQSTL